MTTLNKAIHSYINDVNDDNSVILSLFEKITSALFKLVMFIGIPLFLFLIFRSMF